MAGPQPATERILITGGAGFIGGHTARELLRRGHHVTVLDIFDPKIHRGERLSELPPEVNVVTADVRDGPGLLEAVDGCDALYHFAAETGVGEGEVRPEHYYDVNVNGTVQLWSAIERARSRPKRVVLASSRAVYGEGMLRCPDCGPQLQSGRSSERLSVGRWAPACPACGRDLEPAATPEGWPAGPVSIYGHTKHLQEVVSQFHAWRGGAALTILRYFNVYGPGQSLSNPYTGIVTHFAFRLLNDEDVPLYEEGVPLRDFVYIDDVVAANVESLRFDEGIRCINVGSGEATTIGELARALQDCTASRGAVVSTRRYRTSDIFACHADVRRLRSTFPERRPTSLRTGLGHLVEWLRSVPSTEVIPLEAVEQALGDAGIVRTAVGRDG